MGCPSNLGAGNETPRVHHPSWRHGSGMGACGTAQDQRVRRIGILTALDEAENKIRIDPLLQELPRLGWSDGRNVQIDMRAAGGNTEALRKYATELLASAPDVLVAFGSAPTDQLLQATRTAPIVFMIVVDPLGSGFVNNLARPGGNVTGFMLFEYSLSGKWLDLLKQIAPDMRRVAVIRDPSVSVRNWAVRRHPRYRSGARPGSNRDQHTRPGRDGAGRLGFRRLAEWRPSRDGRPVVHALSKSDHHACRQAQTAFGLTRFASLPPPTD